MVVVQIGLCLGMSARSSHNVHSHHPSCIAAWYILESCTLAQLELYLMIKQIHRRLVVILRRRKNNNILILTPFFLSLFVFHGVGSSTEFMILIYLLSAARKLALKVKGYWWCCRSEIECVCVCVCVSGMRIYKCVQRNSQGIVCGAKVGVDLDPRSEGGAGPVEV